MLRNSIPAMIAMLMVLIYNVADTFFIGQTHNDLQVAAVSMCTHVFLIFLAVGTIFGVDGVSVISLVHIPNKSSICSKYLYNVALKIPRQLEIFYF